ncbi:hypothetical protein B0H12DRAFT_1069919 [Mycena haematopus]|nr:hypothetical protein B0H12DRAFT_1069919 [Mycena haematopus]
MVRGIVLAFGPVLMFLHDAFLALWRGISTSGEGGILAPAPYASPPEANVEEHPPRAYALGLRDERVWGYGFGDGSGISDIGSDFVRARLARWGACGITSRSSASGSSKFVRTTWAWGKRPCSKVYTTPQHIVRVRVPLG